MGRKSFAIGADSANDSAQAFDAVVRARPTAHREVVADAGIRIERP